MNIKKASVLFIIVFSYGINGEEQKLTQWIAASVLKAKQSTQNKNEWVNNGSIQHYISGLRDLDGNELIQIRTQLLDTKATFCALYANDYTSALHLDKEIVNALVKLNAEVDNLFHSLDAHTRCRFVARQERLSCECITTIPYAYAKELHLTSNEPEIKE
jgi:hypothetical protein